MPLSAEKSIFLAALDKDAATERAAFLNEACADDTQLRASVDELLNAHQRPGNLLDEPPVDTLDYPPPAETAGSVIGPYKLMEQIGEGGFGLVFVAEQQHPVRRKVALKIIKPGMDTREVIARFEAERQALAMMDHPNIARVLDAGATAQGQPYFVMELVRGVPITEFCDQRQLDTRQRLELFVTVCRAVQHAHQKAVIHRDIKPSNVLVTLHDAAPVAKVIDFGVAKAIGHSLTDKTIYTRYAAMIGTPLYMSPEQAQMSGLDVDTRSDIFSLGVLLYELLTGSTPFDRRRLENAGLDELRRIIREEEPPRPSTRLSTLGPGLSSTAASRRIEPARLPTLVRGDLDWIVMKAMEKDRGRRYDTAGALAADVERFLRDQPIEARPPSPAYRFRKFARRHKVTITTVSLVAAAMLLGMGISVWQAAVAVSERDAKDQALQEAVRARREAEEAQRNVEQFAERLNAASVLLASGRAHADAGRWSAAHADYTRATELQPNYYLVWVERGSLFVRLGLWEPAAADFAQALDLGASPAGPSWWGVPQLFARVGDEQRYRQLCEQMLAPATSPDEISFAALRASVVAPLPAIDATQLADRAEALVADMPRRPPGPRPPGERPGGGDPQRQRGFDPPLRGRPPGREGRPPNRPPGFPGGPPDRPFNQSLEPRGAVLYVAGLSHYRAGDYEQAAARLAESLADDLGWPGRMIQYPALAMAWHRLGRGEEAREALAAAEQAIDNWTEAMQDAPVGAMPIPWFDWMECLVQFREAKILITGYAPPDDPRLVSIEERAQAAVRGEEPPAGP